MKKHNLFIFLILVTLFATLPGAALAQSGLPPLCSGVQLQNPNASLADPVSMHFYKEGDNDGVADYVYDVSGGLAADESKSFYIPSVLPSTVPSGQYAVIVTSNLELNSLVNESTCSGSSPYVGASHSGFRNDETSTELYLAFVLSRAYSANWSSALAIQNAGGATATNLIIEFFPDGSSTAIETFTNTDLKAGETWYLDLSTGTYATANLDGFSGTAKITSDQPVAAIANYAPGDGSRLLSYNGVPNTSQILYATQITKHAFSGDYTSGISLYNPNSTATPISIELIPAGSTTPVCTIEDSIPADSTYVNYMGSVSACTSGTLDNGFNGTAIVEVTSGTNEILGIFNFDSAIGQAGAANMVRLEDAATTLYMPQIVRNAFGGYESGWQVVNTTDTSLNLTIKYWRDDNTLTFTDHKPLPANSALTNYVGSAEFQSTIGNDWNGGVVITVDGDAGEIVGQANFVAPSVGDALLVYNAFAP